MKLIGSFEGNVSSNFYQSLGDHEYTQHHAPEDFDYDQAATDLLAAQTALTAAQANIALKADQTDLDTTNTVLATKAGQTDMVDVQTTLGVVNTFKNNADDYFDFTNRLIRDSHTEACIIKNLRVLATDDFQNSSVHSDQFDEAIPEPGIVLHPRHVHRGPEFHPGRPHRLHGEAGRPQ